MSVKILVFPGDGIGPEITEATLAGLKAADRAFGLDLDLPMRDIGLVSLEKEGSTCPDAAVEAARDSHGFILGPTSTFDYPPPDKGGAQPSGNMRRRLELYANIRPSKIFSGVKAHVEAMDLLMVRENTEGFYADRNMFEGNADIMVTPDVAIAIRKITAHASERIARAAYNFAMQRRRKVTIIHKANVLRRTDGLFLASVKKVAETFPQVTTTDLIVDAAAAMLVRKPQDFDVIVTTNMFGDILSDLASELSGSLGMLASLNAGDAHAMAQAGHGSAPDIAGQDKANPAALILSAAMLLNWLGDRRSDERFRRAGRTVSAAVEALIARGERTADLGGSLGTAAFGEAIAKEIEQQARKAA